MILWLSQGEINVLLIYLPREVIIGISLWSTLFRIYFIREEKLEISVSQCPLYRAFQISTRQTASLHLSATSQAWTCSRIYEKLWGSDKASSRLFHVGFETHNRWPTSIKIERTARRKYRLSTKPGPLYSKAIVSTTTHPQRQAITTRINRWNKLYQHRSWHHMPRSPFTVMNYTVSNHSKINSRINFALKIIFNLNFRVSWSGSPMKNRSWFFYIILKIL